MPQELADKQANTITDDEVAGFVAQWSTARGVRVLQAAGRDAMGRSMVVLDVEGREPGTYSVGRAIAMISGQDRAPSHAAPPPDPHAKLLAKRHASQLLDGELEAVAEYSIIHPHISYVEAQEEELRREAMPGRRVYTGPVTKVYDRGYVGSTAQIDWAVKIKPAMIARIRGCASLTHARRDTLCAHVEAKRSARDPIDMSKGRISKELAKVLSEVGIPARDQHMWWRKNGAGRKRILA